MKFIRKQVDEIKKPFLKGGKLEILYPAFNAFETMLFVPDHTTSKGSHIRDGVDLKRTIMILLFKQETVITLKFQKKGEILENIFYLMILIKVILIKEEW